MSTSTKPPTKVKKVKEINPGDRYLNADSQVMEVEKNTPDVHHYSGEAYHRLDYCDYMGNRDHVVARANDEFSVIENRG